MKLVSSRTLVVLLYCMNRCVLSCWQGNDAVVPYSLRKHLSLSASGHQSIVREILVVYPATRSLASIDLVAFPSPTLDLPRPHGTTGFRNCPARSVLGEDQAMPPALKHSLNGYSQDDSGWAAARDTEQQGTAGADDTWRDGEFPRSGAATGDDTAATGAASDKAGGTAIFNLPSFSESMEIAAQRSVPLKVMVFVDGTWLYYSFFGRGSRCHISAKFGPDWSSHYRVKWGMLPAIISRALHEQLIHRHQPCRLVEVVKTVVFSSARQDTGRDSTRMLMFEDMRQEGFEVHMATTTGVQEKCIDIALAVEMIHYATIPHTYDVGVLVTGDKDFMPAMSRTRQKGRRVCLCSMHNSCNKDILVHDAHVMDFHPVWIDEYLDEMIEKGQPQIIGMVDGPRQHKVPAEVLCEYVIHLLEEAGGTVGSRHLGRELARIVPREDGMTALAVIKEQWGSLSKFFREQNDLFLIRQDQPDPMDPSIRQFIVTLVDRQNSMKSVKLGEVVDDPNEGETGASSFDAADDDEESWEGSSTSEDQLVVTAESLSKEKVPQLKERLREKGLPLSGKKVELVERLLEAMRSEASVLSPPTTRRSFPQGHSELIYESSTHNGFASTMGDRSLDSEVDEELVKGRNRWYVQNALVDMISALFVNDDGTRREVVYSRNVGRALSELPAPDGSEQSALSCLKSRWISLKAFLKSCPAEFELTEGEPTGDSIEFGVMKVPAGNRAGEVNELEGERRYSGARPSASSVALRDLRGGGEWSGRAAA